MRTVEKALRLLEIFDSQHPEFGLSELARRSRIDKATVLRMLGDLAATGMVEQDAQSRQWRLGAGVLRLARLREAAFPVARVLTPILEHLAQATGETAHAALISGDTLGTVGVSEAQRPNRVHVDPGLILPLHATASGVAFTAFARPERRAEIVARALDGFTETTPTTQAALIALIEQTAARGYALADQTYETEVFGVALPLFGHDGYATGAVAIALPASRALPSHIATLVAALSPAAEQATVGMGGRVPAHHRIAA